MGNGIPPRLLLELVVRLEELDVSKSVLASNLASGLPPVLPLELVLTPDSALLGDLSASVVAESLPPTLLLESVLRLKSEPLISGLGPPCRLESYNVWKRDQWCFMISIG